MCVCVRYNGQLSIIIKYTGKKDTDTKSHSHTHTQLHAHTEARASKQKVSARCKLHGQQQQHVGEREKLTRRRLKLYWSKRYFKYTKAAAKANEDATTRAATTTPTLPLLRCYFGTCCPCQLMGPTRQQQQQRGKRWLLFMNTHTHTHERVQLFSLCEKWRYRYKCTYIHIFSCTYVNTHTHAHAGTYFCLLCVYSKCTFNTRIGSWARNTLTTAATQHKQA